MSVVHTCINIAELENALSSRSHNCTSNVQLFYSGRLLLPQGDISACEDCSTLVSGLGISDFVLQIFGSGPLEQPLREYLARHGLERNIELRGHVPHRILLAGLADSDIVCVPSLYEACPVAVIEAMAMGKPVVAFDVPFARNTPREWRTLASDSSDSHRNSRGLFVHKMTGRGWDACSTKGLRSLIQTRLRWSIERSRRFSLSITDTWDRTMIERLNTENWRSTRLCQRLERQ